MLTYIEQTCINSPLGYRRAYLQTPLVQLCCGLSKTRWLQLDFGNLEHHLCLRQNINEVNVMRSFK